MSVVVSLGLGVDFPNRLSRKKRGGCGCGMTPPRRLRARNGQSLFHGLCLCHPISWFDPPPPLANESWHGFTPPQVIPSPFHACSPPIDLGTMTIIFRLPERAGVEVGVEARPLPTHEHRCRHLMVWVSPRGRGNPISIAASAPFSDEGDSAVDREVMLEKHSSSTLQTRDLPRFSSCAK